MSRIQSWFLLLVIFVVLSCWFYTWFIFDPMEEIFIMDGAGDGYNGGAVVQKERKVTNTTSESPAVEWKNSERMTFSETRSAPASLLSSHIPNVKLRSQRNIFDCASDVQDPQCVYFDPSTYFNEKHGPLPQPILESVKNYWSNQYSKSTHEPQDLFWYSIQRDVGVYNLLEWNSNSSNPLSGWPRTMMGLHIHKCGGSTVGRTFLKIANSGNSSRKGYNVTLFYKNNLRSKFEGQNAESLANHSIELHQCLLQQIYDNQQASSSSPPADHVAFTFVRDVLERFQSSVREFLLSRNRKRRLCLEAPTSKDLLKCILSKLHQENGLQLDQHFAPATISLYMFSLLEPRVKISILPLTNEAMKGFQTFFLGPQSKPLKLKSSKPRNFNITMDDLDFEMIRDICNLYLMDVLLLRYLRLPATICDGMLLEYEHHVLARNNDDTT
jgi:hypothetical protein